MIHPLHPGRPAIVLKCRIHSCQDGCCLVATLGLGAHTYQASGPRPSDAMRNLQTFMETQTGLPCTLWTDGKLKWSPPRPFQHLTKPQGPTFN